MNAQGRLVYQHPINHPVAAVLDVRDDHAIAYVTAKAVRIKGHGELTWVLVRAIYEAGGTGYREMQIQRNSLRFACQG
jgi:hypothetical protein